MLDCYNFELIAGTLVDLKWSPFRQQLIAGSQYLSSQGIWAEMC